MGMNPARESDRPIVPEKRPNKGGGAPPVAEAAEGRGLTKGNPSKRNKVRTQSRERHRYGAP